MRTIFLAAPLFAALLVFGGCGDEAPPQRQSRARSTDAAPSAQQAPRGQLAFRAPALDGRTVSVRGPVALFFFTSWCGYCKQAMPEVQRLANQAQAKGWRVYGIDVNETPDKAEWFVQNYRPNFPVLLDQSGQVASQYGVNGFPTFTLIDADGRVVYNAHELPRNF